MAPRPASFPHRSPFAVRMKVTHLYLAALGLASASLSSCSRATYSFNPATPAYLHSVPAAATTPAPAPAVQSVASAVQPAVPVVAAVPPKAGKPAAVRSVYAATPRAAAVPALAAPAATVAPKLNLTQRLVLKKAGKQLTKAQSRTQNTASVAQTARRSGSLTIAILGLIALIVGIAVGSATTIVIGAIVLVIGLIFALLSIF